MIAVSLRAQCMPPPEGILHVVSHTVEPVNVQDCLRDALVNPYCVLVFWSRPIPVCCSPPSLQDQAEDMGNMAQVEDLKRQLEDLEERAEQLDKERSKGLSAIRWGKSRVQWAVC